MMDMFRSFWAEDSGQGLADRSLFTAVVIIVLIAGVVVFRDEVLDFFSWIDRTFHTRL